MLAGEAQSGNMDYLEREGSKFEVSDCGVNGSMCLHRNDCHVTQAHDHD